MGIPVRGTGKRLRTNTRERKACVGHGSGANVVERLHHAARRAPATTWVTYAGWFGLPRCGTGARYGLSVSASIRSSGHSRAASCRSVAVLNVTMPLKRQERAALEALPGLVGPAGEAVEDRALRRALGVEDVERVCPRVAGVDDQRQ